MRKGSRQSRNGFCITRIGRIVPIPGFGLLPKPFRLRRPPVVVATHESPMKLHGHAVGRTTGQANGMPGQPIVTARDFRLSPFIPELSELPPRILDPLTRKEEI